MIGLETQYTHTKRSGPDLWLAAAGAAMIGLFALLIPYLGTDDSSTQAEDRNASPAIDSTVVVTPDASLPDTLAMDTTDSNSIRYYSDSR